MGQLDQYGGNLNNPFRNFTHKQEIRPNFPKGKPIVVERIVIITSMLMRIAVECY